MNKTKIEYGNYAWNPVTGCLHGCPYCWAQKMARRYYMDDFKPTIYPNRLDDPSHVKKPGRVLVSFMGDLFGDWVPESWILSVITRVKLAPQHKYLFLTKNPKRYMEFEFPGNCWLGFSDTGEREMNRSILSSKNRTFISYEPLLAKPVFFKDPPSWIIIGAQTRPEIQPDRQWILDIIEYAKIYKIPIFMKDNLKWNPKRREYPGGLK